MSGDSEPVRLKRNFLQALGPAFIVASVVLGPGSILTNSRVGTHYGYQMIWLLVLAGGLMFILTSLSARLGVLYENSFCEELRRRYHPLVGAVVGISVFLICACFQFTNNLGVIAAIEPFFKDDVTGASNMPEGLATGLLIGLNALIIATLFGLKKIYKPLERVMMFLVAVMILMFALNVIVAQPDLLAAARGLIPSLPEGEWKGLWPRIEEGAEGRQLAVSPAVALVALVATTLSVAGAFYQGYLVKEKGWDLNDLPQQKVDSAAGIFVLTGISLIIMLTSAAVLHGNVAAGDLKDVSAVARQLQPLLGSWGGLAEALFCVGIFAGAFSSFLGNSLIGGVLLSDGLGLDWRLEGTATKVCTSLGLLAGMVVAVFVPGEDRVTVIVFGQGLTVLGLPIVALAMIALSWQARKEGKRIPAWMTWGGTIVMGLVLLLAARTAWMLVLQLSLALSGQSG